MKRTQVLGIVTSLVGTCLGAATLGLALASAPEAAPPLALAASGQVYTGSNSNGPIGSEFAPVSGSLDQSLTPTQIEEARALLAEIVAGQTIVGPDNRVRVIDATVAPYRSVVHLVKFVGGQVSSLCTGTFVATDVVLTAAHCIQSDSVEPMPQDFLIVPAENGGGFPFGTDLATDWIYPNAWKASGYREARYDIALVRVAHPQLGQAVGNLGVITAMTDADLNSGSLNAYTIGYPADKAIGTMWGTGIDRMTVVYPDVLVYELDVTHGQSGAAIFRSSDRRIFGIVSQGCEPAGVVCDFSGNEPLYANYGIRITVTVAQTLAGYCVQIGCVLYYEVPVGGGSTPTPTRTATPTPTPVPSFTATPPVTNTATPTKTFAPTATPPTNASGRLFRGVIMQIARD